MHTKHLSNYYVNVPYARRNTVKLKRKLAAKNATIYSMFVVFVAKDACVEDGDEPPTVVDGFVVDAEFASPHILPPKK